MTKPLLRASFLLCAFFCRFGSSRPWPALHTRRRNPLLHRPLTCWKLVEVNPPHLVVDRYAGCLYLRILTFCLTCLFLKTNGPIPRTKHAFKSGRDLPGYKGTLHPIERLSLVTKHLGQPTPVFIYSCTPAPRHTHAAQYRKVAPKKTPSRFRFEVSNTRPRAFFYSPGPINLRSQ